MAGYTVEQAAAALTISSSTVRRLIGRELKAVEGAKPLRIDEESLARARTSRLDALASPGASAFPDEPALRSRVTALDLENENLRNTVSELRAALQLLSDSLGRFTEPKLPNN